MFIGTTCYRCFSIFESRYQGNLSLGNIMSNQSDAVTIGKLLQLKSYFLLKCIINSMSILFECLSEIQLSHSFVITLEDTDLCPLSFALSVFVGCALLRLRVFQCIKVWRCRPVMEGRDLPIGLRFSSVFDVSGTLDFIWVFYLLSLLSEFLRQFIYCTNQDFFTQLWKHSV